MKIYPTTTRVLLEVIDIEKPKTDSSIFIPESVKDKKNSSLTFLKVGWSHYRDNYHHYHLRTRSFIPQYQLHLVYTKTYLIIE